MPSGFSVQLKVKDIEGRNRKAAVAAGHAVFTALLRRTT